MPPKTKAQELQTKLYKQQALIAMKIQEEQAYIQNRQTLTDELQARAQQRRMMTSELQRVLQEHEKHMWDERESMRRIKHETEVAAEREASIRQSLQETLAQVMKEQASVPVEADASVGADHGDGTVASIQAVVEFFSEEGLFHVTPELTFGDLKEDACRFFDVHPNDCALENVSGGEWPVNKGVMEILLDKQHTQKPALILSIHKELIHVDKEVRVDEELLALQALLMEDEEERDDRKGKASDMGHSKRELFVELLVFVCFLAVFLMSMLAKRSIADGFLMVGALQSTFLESLFGSHLQYYYDDMRTVTDFFDWAQTVFIDSIYVTSEYNGAEIEMKRQNMVMTYNKVVGAIRLRQVRVEEDSCILSPLTIRLAGFPNGTVREQKFVERCYNFYSIGTRSTKPFGPALNASLNISGFEWSEGIPNTPPAAGLAGSYDGSGYIRDVFGESRENMVTALQELKDNKWIDKKTRAVVIAFTVYNANYDYYVSIRFLLELTPGGVLIPTANFKALKMQMYKEFSARTLLAFVTEMVVYAFVLTYTLDEIAEAKETKHRTGKWRNYFTMSGWNCMEAVIVISLYVSLILRLRFFLDEDRIWFWVFEEKFQETYHLADQYIGAFQADSISVAFCFFKLFKFFSLSPPLHMLWMTIVKAGQDTGIFIIMFMQLFIAYAIMGMNIFGSELVTYSSFGSAFNSLFLMILGDFDFEELRRANRTWAAIFFGTFMLIFFFTLVNVFLAILNDAYTLMRTEKEIRDATYTGPQVSFHSYVTLFKIIIKAKIVKIIQKVREMTKVKKKR